MYNSTIVFNSQPTSKPTSFLKSFFCFFGTTTVVLMKSTYMFDGDYRYLLNLTNPQMICLWCFWNGDR
jgi:hypothetical protein